LTIFHLQGDWSPDSTTPDEVDDLDLIARMQNNCVPLGFRHNRMVQLDRNPTAAQIKPFYERKQSHLRTDRVGLAVQLD
jgi:hypothetical protein